MITRTTRLLANAKLFTSAGSDDVGNHLCTLLPGPLAPVLNGREALKWLGLKPLWAYTTEILIAKARQPNKHNDHKKTSLTWPKANFNEVAMATAETMKMLTTTQPLISDKSSDENDSELDHVEDYNTSNDLSYDYGSEGDASDKGDLTPSSNPSVCQHFLQGRCHFGSRCWNHHPEDKGEVGEEVEESDSDDARDSHSQSSNDFDTTEIFLMMTKVTSLIHTVQLTKKLPTHIAMKMLSVMTTMKNMTRIVTMVTAPSDLHAITITLHMAAGMAINADLDTTCCLQKVAQ
jgi:hypothetical protein